MNRRAIGLGAAVLLLGPPLLLAGLVASAKAQHHQQLRQLEAELLAAPLPAGAVLVDHGRAVQGPISSNYCLLDAAIVVDGVGSWADPPGELTVDGTGPMPGHRVAADLASAHPPKPGRVFVERRVHDASSFAFRWNPTCH